MNIFCVFRSLSSTVEFVLGTYGMAPWGTTYGSVMDSTAKWIWNTANADTSAPVGKVSFGMVYFNPHESTYISARFIFLADNTAQAYMNGGYIGSNGPLQAPILIPPGYNTFVINAVNLGDSPNPAGLIYALVDSNGNVLIHSGYKFAGKHVHMWPVDWTMMSK